MLNRLTGVLRAAKEHSVGASGCAECELIESDDFTASLEDASASGLCYAESADAELRDLEKADIVSDAANEDCGLTLLALHEVYQLGERKRRAVHLRHKKSLEDNLVEIAVSAANQEAVKLHREKRGEKVRYTVLGQMKGERNCFFNCWR